MASLTTSISYSNARHPLLFLAPLLVSSPSLPSSSSIVKVRSSGRTIPERCGGIFALYSPLRILHPAAEIVKRRITRFKSWLLTSVSGTRLSQTAPRSRARAPSKLFHPRVATESAVRYPHRKWFSVLVEPFPNALELGLLRCLNRGVTIDILQRCRKPREDYVLVRSLTQTKVWDCVRSPVHGFLLG